MIGIVPPITDSIADESPTQTALGVATGITACAILNIHKQRTKKNTTVTSLSKSSKRCWGVNICIL
jgi:hypothetical protein